LGGMVDPLCHAAHRSGQCPLAYISAQMGWRAWRLRLCRGICASRGLGTFFVRVATQSRSSLRVTNFVHHISHSHTRQRRSILHQ
jgi:hypothetical protein